MKDKNFFTPTLPKIIAFVLCFVLLYYVELDFEGILGIFLLSAHTLGGLRGYPQQQGLQNEPQASGGVEAQEANTIMLFEANATQTGSETVYALCQPTIGVLPIAMYHGGFVWENGDIPL